MKQLTSAAAVCILLAGVCHGGAAYADQPIAVSDNEFGFKLLKQLGKDQPAGNISISPYSAATVFQMVENGAEGSTKSEMQQVLGTTGLSAAVVNSANKDIAMSLRKEDGSVMLTTANAVWYRPGTPVRPAFIATNREFYGATVDALNFSDPHAVDVINSWASDNTHGKIQRIADGMIDSVNTRLLLANAIYFKGKWSSPFAVQNTKERPFYLRGGGKKMIPMMTTTRSLAYRQGSGYQAVRLPYVGENLAMYVFLPDSSSSPRNILDMLSGDAWQREIKPEFKSTHGTIVLPKFKVEYSVELRRPLQSLGMKAAFDASTADFSGIGPGLFISAARQKTFVEVNEEGTEAAAVTGVAVTATSVVISPPPFQMIVDRPFIFMIEHRQTGAILFLGVLFDPPTGS
jgi:serine protease inhibitor